MDTPLAMQMQKPVQQQSFHHPRGKISLLRVGKKDSIQETRQDTPFGVSAGTPTGTVPGDDNKRDPERENLAVLTIAAQTANVIHIRVTFNVVTR